MTSAVHAVNQSPVFLSEKSQIIFLFMLGNFGIFIKCQIFLKVSPDQSRKIITSIPYLNTIQTWYCPRSNIFLSQFLFSSPCHPHHGSGHHSECSLQLPQQVPAYHHDVQQRGYNQHTHIHINATHSTFCLMIVLHVFWRLVVCGDKRKRLQEVWKEQLVSDVKQR